VTVPPRKDMIHQHGAIFLSLYYLTGNIRPNEPVGFYILTVLAVAILILLISLVEMVALQLLRWGNTRQVLRASLAMNLISSVVGIILLVLFPQPNVRNVLLAWPILFIVEGIVLSRIRPGTLVFNWFAAAVANLASYIILILPAFLFRG
jgi:hypothetical protein